MVGKKGEHVDNGDPTNLIPTIRNVESYRFF